MRESGGKRENIGLREGMKRKTARSERHLRRDTKPSALKLPIVVEGDPEEVSK